MQKYILTDETKVVGEHPLYRIKAVRDFGNVRAGEFGGWISSELNLSQDGKCWVADEAMVSEEAFISGNARVSNQAMVFNQAKVYGDAIVNCNSRVYGQAMVFNQASIHDKAEVFEKALIAENAVVKRNARVHGETRILGHATIRGESSISGKVSIRGNAYVGGNAYIESPENIIWMDNVSSEYEILTAYHTQSGEICVKCGCFEGPIEQFKHTIKEKYAGTKREKDYLTLITFIKQRLGQSLS